MHLLRALPARRSLLVALALLAVLATVGGPVTTAQAASNVTLAGHGNGHGRGLGQYGALGYAVDQSWSWQQIVARYYGGTTTGSVGNPDMTVRLTALDSAASVTVTSSLDFWVGDSNGAYRISGGDAATLSWTGSAWTVVGLAGGCSGTAVGGAAPLPSVPEVAPTAAPTSSPASVLTVCSSHRGYRGKLRFVVDSGATRVVDVVDTESYLRGVVPRESPASWGDLGGGKGINALAAQAVAARSYAISENRYSYAKTCDTTSCQVYGGAALNGAWIEDSRSDQAVSLTAGQGQLTSNGAVARTEFSASTGGYTAGGTFPAVADDGDATSSNPYHNWQVTIPASTVVAAWPAIGSFSSMVVTGRNGLGADGGRVTTVDVVGTASTVHTTGDDVRIRLGLGSNWFTPLGPNVLWSELRNSPTAGAADYQVRTGSPTGTELACDFNGSGSAQLAVYDAGVWTIRNTLTSGPADSSFQYGAAGWIPVCGDWTGSGKAGVGVYDPSTGTWYLRNTASAGSADVQFQYGWSGGYPVVGDWNGDGTTTVGVWDKAKGIWMVRNTNAPGAPDVQFQFGFAGAIPVPGDWNADGRVDVGVYSQGTWYLRDAFGPGSARTFGYGLSTDLPVVGRWTTAAGTGIGVYRPDRQ